MMSAIPRLELSQLPERARENYNNTPSTFNRRSATSSVGSARFSPRASARDLRQSRDEFIRKQRVIRYMAEERERAERSKITREEHDLWIELHGNERFDRLRYMTESEIAELLQRESMTKFSDEAVLAPSSTPALPVHLLRQAQSPAKVRKMSENNNNNNHQENKRTYEINEVGTEPEINDKQIKDKQEHNGQEMQTPTKEIMQHKRTEESSNKQIPFLVEETHQYVDQTKNASPLYYTTSKPEISHHSNISKQSLESYHECVEQENDKKCRKEHDAKNDNNSNKERELVNMTTLSELVPQYSSIENISSEHQNKANNKPFTSASLTNDKPRVQGLTSNNESCEAETNDAEMHDTVLAHNAKLEHELQEERMKAVNAEAARLQLVQEFAQKQKELLLTQQQLQELSQEFAQYKKNKEKQQLDDNTWENESHKIIYDDDTTSNDENKSRKINNICVLNKLNEESELIAELNTLKTTVSSLQEQIVKKDNELALMQGRLKDQERTSAEWRRAAAVSKQEISKLEDELRCVVERKTELEQEVKQERAASDALRANITKLQEQVNVLRQSNDTSSPNSIVQNDVVVNNNNSYNNNKKDANYEDEEDNQVRELESHINKLVNENKMLEEQVGELNALRVEMEEKINEERAAHAHSVEQALRKVQLNGKAVNGNVDDRVMDVKETVDNYKQEIDNLRSQLADANAQIDALRKEKLADRAKLSVDEYKTKSGAFANDNNCIPTQESNTRTVGNKHNNASKEKKELSSSSLTSIESSQLSQRINNQRENHKEEKRILQRNNNKTMNTAIRMQPAPNVAQIRKLQDDIRALKAQLNHSQQREREVVQEYNEYKRKMTTPNHVLSKLHEGTDKAPIHEHTSHLNSIEPLSSSLLKSSEQLQKELKDAKTQLLILTNKLASNDEQMQKLENDRCKWENMYKDLTDAHNKGIASNSNNDSINNNDLNNNNHYVNNDLKEERLTTEKLSTSELKPRASSTVANDTTRSHSNNEDNRDEREQQTSLEESVIQHKTNTTTITDNTFDGINHNDNNHMSTNASELYHTSDNVNTVCNMQEADKNNNAPATLLPSPNTSIIEEEKQNTKNVLDITNTTTDAAATNIKEGDNLLVEQSKPMLSHVQQTTLLTMANDGTDYPVTTTTTATIPNYTDNINNNNNYVPPITPITDATNVCQPQITRQAVRQRKSRAGCCGC